MHTFSRRRRVFGTAAWLWVVLAAGLQGQSSGSRAAWPTWTDLQATLGVSATITDCGGHTGCAMTTTTPPPGPGGPSPVPQPWPAGVREMLVDGWRGKTYRIDVTGDPTRDATFALTVTYRITCES